ncbi:MAG: hypothetical protein HY784_19290 [Chloroflexi bacterium]|nr:hypothetical protein [Chloroflexota bacterium]
MLLFLRRPEHSSLVPELVVKLEPSAGEVLRHMYTAAVYLQRLWRGALSLYLDEQFLLPDHFGRAEFGLPPPDDCFGEAGLRELARLFEARTGAEWLSAYQTTMSLFLQQLRLERQYDRSAN